VSLTAAERQAIARLGAHTHWAKCPDRTARTAAWRDGFNRKLAAEVDPEGTLAPDELARRVENARRAHMARMTAAALAARRRKAKDLTTKARATRSPG
jgi:hypothetical protein